MHMFVQPNTMPVGILEAHLENAEEALATGDSNHHAS